MTLERKGDRAPSSHADASHDIGPTEGLVAPDAENAWQTVIDFIEHGKGAARELPVALRKLDQDHRAQAYELLPKLRERVAGDVYLECALAAGSALDLAIDEALTAHPPISDTRLRAELRARTPEQLAFLDRHTKVLERIKTLMPGKFAMELPQLATLPPAIHKAPEIIRWFLAETDPTVAALTLAEAGVGSTELPKTIAKHKLWSWLKDIHIGASLLHGAGLSAFRDETPIDSPERKQLDAILATYTSDDKLRDERQPAARARVEHQLDEGGDTASLLDAEAQLGTVEGLSARKLDARLKQESAATILQFALVGGLPLSESIPLLARAKGATADQMRLLLTKSDWVRMIDALAVDHLRNEARDLLGRNTPLLTLAPDEEQQRVIHVHVVRSDHLREWAYSSHDPRTSLFLAAGSAAGAELGCREVARTIGFGWVRQLSPDASGEQLRRLALNCPHAPTAKFVREHLLGDRAYTIDATENEAQPIERESQGKGDRARVDIAVGEKDHDSTKVLDRLADMTVADRMALLKEPGETKRILDHVDPGDLLRAVYLLCPTIPQLLALPIHAAPQLLDYLRTRPASEEAAALADTRAVAGARSIFPKLPPLVIFPSLRDPHALANALGQETELLEWLLADTDASSALALLARDPVRKVAVERMEKRPSLYAGLPAYEHLMPAGKTAFDKIGRELRDDDAKDSAADYRAGEVQIDAAADDRAKRLQNASNADHLWEALDATTDRAAALTLVQSAPGSDQIELLAGLHSKTVTHLRVLTGLTPQHVFAMSISQLLVLDDAATWLLDYTDAFVLLAEAATQPPLLAQLGRLIDFKPDLGAKWIANLPEAAQLTPVERQALDQLRNQIAKNETALHVLFHKRFGAKLDATFNFAETHRLWNVLQRLPPAQVDQEVITKFTHDELGGNATGLWDGKKAEVEIDSDPTKLEGDMSSFDSSPWLTAAEIQKYYGLDAAALVKAVETGWIVEKDDKYQVKPIPFHKFESTVLHEVGHSVDTLLGNHTPFIYELAGWKRYGVDQFETWATEMGALASIPQVDRAKIVTVWKDAIRSNTPVDQLVDDKHPARSEKYASDPLVQAAKDSHLFGYRHEPRPILNGRGFVTNGATLGSLDQRALETAPSAYGLSAPAEYFAECYVEYYRLYDGTPATTHLKGGKLATWIKEWFDANVDTIRLNPHRLRDKKEGGGEAAPKVAQRSQAPGAAQR
jgi:hypothetical protein